jgi:hypothetical protein
MHHIRSEGSYMSGGLNYSIATRLAREKRLLTLRANKLHLVKGM